MDKEILKAAMKEALSEQELVFPRHLYVPKGSMPIDWRSAVIVPAQTTDRTTIFEYRAKTSEFITFIQYGIFNEGVLADEYDFYPTINDNRILRLHGDPADNFRLNFSVGNSLDNNSMITCNFRLQPDEILKWEVVNRSNANTRMGVRLVGFLENNFKEAATFG